MTLLSIRDLRINYGDVVAVQDVNLDVEPGERVGIVGESGSGKTTLALALMRLLPPAGSITSGHISLDGTDLTDLPEERLRPLRGSAAGMVFQDPLTSFDPLRTLGDHLSEGLRAHGEKDRGRRRERAVAALRSVGMPAPASQLARRPHELSGGMRQRGLIALGLSNEPRLLIADEPTTALDVTTQAQILELMRRLRTSHGSAIILITHDMGVISEIADQVLVMYGGRAVERGSKTDVFRRPRHPYTWGLLDSVPRVTGPRVRRLAAIPGSPVRPWDLPTGCVFAPRCALRHEACEARPELRGFDGPGADGHLDACWLPDNRAELRQRARVFQP